MSETFSAKCVAAGIKRNCDTIRLNVDVLDFIFFILSHFEKQ